MDPLSLIQRLTALSLFHKLLGFLILCLSLGGLLAAWLVTQQMSNLVYRQAFQEFENGRYNLNILLREHQTWLRESVLDVARNEDLLTTVEIEVLEELQNITKSLQVTIGVDDVLVVDAQGRVLSQGYDNRHKLDAEMMVQSEGVNHVGGLDQIYSRAPLRTGEGKSLGAVLLVQTLTGNRDFFAKLRESSGKETILIFSTVDDSGEGIARQVGSSIDEVKSDIERHPVTLGLFTTTDGKFLGTELALDPVFGRDDWRVILLESAAPLRGSIRRVQWASVVFTVAIIGLIAGIVGLFYSTHIRKPMEQIVQGLTAITQGDLETRLHLGRRDEWNLIEESLNSMTGNLSASAAENNALNERIRAHSAELEVRVEQRTEELHLASSEATKARERLTTAIETISEGFALFDADERLVVCNTRYRSMIGGDQAASAPIGMTFDAIVGDAAAKGRIVDAIGRVDEWAAERLQSFRNPIEAHVYQLSDNRWIQVNERKTEDTGTVAIYSDITELKEREFALLEAMKHAEAASEAKGAFLANVSHELRTPLTSILGFTRMNQKRMDERVLPALETENPRTKRAVRQISENTEIILAEGTRLTALINNVLDLAKIEAGEMDWDISPLHPGELIERAVAATEFLPREKGLELSVDVTTDLPAVLGDGDKVVQVIVNLVSNAAKFTDQGSIICRARSDGKGTIDFSVSDTGCGIAEGDQGVVFEQFRQVGDTLTDKPTGTGLGLPICKEIVDQLGGRIWVESKLNEGSTFHFTLPLAP